MKVIVVGGGPSGMIAAITSAQNGNNVIIIERNKFLGKKILVTGKGRCNVTFDGDIDDFKRNIILQEAVTDKMIQADSMNKKPKIVPLKKVFNQLFKKN